MYLFAITIILLGESSSKASVDCQKVEVREGFKHIGYEDSGQGFDYRTPLVMYYQPWSTYIDQGIHVRWDGMGG